MRDGIKAAKVLRAATPHDIPVSREIRDEALGGRGLGGGRNDLRGHEQVAELRVENRHLAAQVAALRSRASAVLQELDTKMLARSVARQAIHLLNTDVALVELYDQDVAYFRTSHLRQSTLYVRAETTRDLDLDSGSRNSFRNG
jgi:hypothetical protein